MELTQIVQKDVDKELLLIEEMEWLKVVITHTLQFHFNKDSHENGKLITPPSLKGFSDPYARFVKSENLSEQERLVLILALMPHINPIFLDEIISKCVQQTGDFPQLGGVKGESYRGFIPTLETAIFILSGMDIAERFELLKMLSDSSLSKIVYIGRVPIGEPYTSGKLIVDRDYIELFTLGRISKPSLSAEFPAQYISTDLKWDDLVLNETTMEQVAELENWIKYNNVLLHEWKMNKHLLPGYRALFFGPPGTGKTLTAKLLGKFTGKDVFRVDLSLVVSKYIGETEKNLGNLFDKAEDKGWILFFDEADALFGKRTNVRDAHDKYANQEVSFLLQRTENYSGLVILASNFKGNIDESFARRFQSHIYFAPPKFAERLKIWQNALPETVEIERDVNLKSIAKQYELTGANIMNVIQFACLRALARETNKLIYPDILEGIEKEFSKEGKML